MSETLFGGCLFTPLMSPGDKKRPLVHLIWSLMVWIDGSLDQWSLLTFVTVASPCHHKRHAVASSSKGCLLCKASCADTTTAVTGPRAAGRSQRYAGSAVLAARQLCKQPRRCPSDMHAGLSK